MYYSKPKSYQLYVIIPMQNFILLDNTTQINHEMNNDLNQQNLGYYYSWMKKYKFKK